MYKILIIALAALFVFSQGCSNYSIVEVLEIEGCKITLSKPSSFENTVPVFLELEKDGQSIRSSAIGAFDPSDISESFFSFNNLKKNKVIYVTETENPNLVLCIVDYKNMGIWPSFSSSISEERAKEIECEIISASQIPEIRVMGLLRE